jgi:ABC-2 type transport system ATP-binding protein
MRCEVAASLLHKPKLLLLDEPSIGLDVVAKQHLRDTIRRMSQVEKVGVLLTSHDAGDLEALCKRVIIINHGQIVYQDKVSALKRRYLTRKEVGVRYAAEVAPDFDIEGAEVLKIGQYGVKLQFDSRHTPVDAIMGQIAERGSVVDITISDPSLEEVIAQIYEQAERKKG